ncbi:hypothetical protein COO60DRAFT_1637364 [Scenedesmus sp. NREL 46B-D3]|nr:hypothetical protein COO60DRAFT_1637364 [Scenedesmus sp. NREL 46B-D3]
MKPSSGDAKLLLVAAGEPDHSIMVWRWYSSKLALVITPELPVCCAALNPWEDSLLAAAGPHSVCSYRLDLATATAKPNNLLKLDHSGSTAITCIAYLVGGMLAVGSSTGRIMVYSEAGLAASMDISTAGDSQHNSSSGSSSSSSSSGSNHQQHSPASPSSVGRQSSETGAAAAPWLPRSAAVNGVQALVQRGRGFIAAGSMWDVYLFDPSGATSKRTQLTLNPISSTTVTFSGSNSSSALAADARVMGLTVSVTDDHIALTTAAGKLLLLDITAAVAAMDEAAETAATAAAVAAGSSDAGAAAALEARESMGEAELDIDPADPNPGGWQVLCAGFPSARVVGLDACLHLPLLLVVSEDRWVRVWDWVRRTGVAARHMPDEQPLCCTLHPSGFMAALGSSEGLRTYYILRRELLPVAHLPVAKCSVARYSHGGALLAAVGRTNAIVVYPAYYGSGAGASGAIAQNGGSSSHYTQRSSAGDNGRGSGGYASAAAAAAASGIGMDGACVMRPLLVLKAHVSTVTDLVFSGDDKRLISSGAGGAVYFWDMSTGARLMDLEYVDKQCVYYTACYNDRHAAAVVRTMDGRVQHIQDGQLAYELTGLGNDASPLAVTGDGRVVLACTNRGSIISIAWPKDPAAAGRRQQEQQQQQQSAANDGNLLANTAAELQDAEAASGSYAGLTAASLGALVPAGGVPGLPLPVVLVDEGLLLAMRERLRSMAAAVTTAQKEAQYQVLRQTQALKESLGLSDSQAAQLSREVAQLRTALADSQVAADTNQQQVAKELESLHAAAAEQLEGLYEARLALEGERLAQLAAAKDDLELSLKEINGCRVNSWFLHRRGTLAVAAKQQMASEAAKAESAAAAAAEAAAVWQEVLMQTEEDLELQAERDGDRLATARHEAGEAEMKLKAEINILLRSNSRLKADKAADTAHMEALASQLSGLRQQLGEAAAVADKLRGELTERDGVIGDNSASLQGLRRRVQELETHKFVLGYKAEAAASKLQPEQEQLAEMHETLDAQGRELLAGRSALLATQRAVGEKSAAVAAAKQELWEAKQAMARQAGLLEAVAHDIFQVLQQPDERMPGGKTARQQALEQLAVKYCTNRGGGARSSVQVEAEMLAHIAAAEKKSKLLEEQLKHAVAGKSRSGRRLMADNAALLSDLAELQHSNRDLARQLAAATDQLAHFSGVQLAASNKGDLASGSHADASASDAAAAAAAGGTGAGGAVVAGSRPASAVLVHDRPGSAGYVPAFLTAGGSRPASPG